MRYYLLSKKIEAHYCAFDPDEWRQVEKDLVAARRETRRAAPRGQKKSSGEFLRHCLRALRRYDGRVEHRTGLSRNQYEALVRHGQTQQFPVTSEPQTHPDRMHRHFQKEAERELHEEQERNRVEAMQRLVQAEANHPALPPVDPELDTLLNRIRAAAMSR